jgi:hypothetical protein
MPPLGPYERLFEVTIVFQQQRSAVIGTNER